MKDQSCNKLWDFIYDRGAFASAEELEGMAVSQKPDLFVTHYLKLPAAEREAMNACLMSALLGKDKELGKFGGIVLVLVLAVLQRTPGTGFEAFQSELIQELENPERHQAWLQERNESSDFRRDWRYALGILRILAALQTPGVVEIATTMAKSARTDEFRRKLEEIAVTDSKSR